MHPDLWFFRPARSAIACAFFLVLTLAASSARGDLPVGCAELGSAVTDHSCFHATFGPYTTVTAASGVPAPASAPHVDEVHTFYDVVLPNPTGQNTVSYQVASAGRAGTWAIFHDARVPIRILAESGQQQPVVLSHDVGSCRFLPRVDVFELGFERYRIVLGPANVTRAVLVIENISDFIRENGRDADGDGYGARADTVATACIPGAGYVQNVSDCDDANPDIHPGATEICDGIDQNCNGVVDDIGLPCTSGTGKCQEKGQMQCMASIAPAVCSAVASAAGTETCNGSDENCNGISDLDEDGLCTDPDVPSCVLVVGETRCGCDADAECGGPKSARICDLEQRRCVPGCVALPGRNACPDDLVCTSNDPARPGRCVDPASACTDNDGCAATPATPVCLIPPGQIGRCVECVDDTSCAGRDDRRSACIGENHTCAECAAEDDSRCDAASHGAECLPTGLCGCTDDNSCSVEIPDGSVRVLSGRFVQQARVCDLSRRECVESTEATDPDASAAADADGCGCRTAGAPGSSARGLLVVAALAVLVVVRRRRARALTVASALAALLTLSGCAQGEEVQNVESDKGPATVADAGISSVDAGNDADASKEPCGVPELGSKVVGHACSHATHGPFETVVAVEGGAVAPSVNVVHQAYDVVMPSESPPWSGGVAYSPARDGRHAIFTAPAVGLRVLSGNTEVSAVHRQDMSNDACTTLDYAAVVPLSKGQPVRIELSDSPDRQVKLFIEHLGTFEEKAWATDCRP